MWEYEIQTLELAETGKPLKTFVDVITWLMFFRNRDGS